MALTVVTLEKQDRIGTLTLNRPEKLNALNRSVIGEFAEAIDVVAADPDLKVLIIRGAGRAFSTGYDLSGGGRSTPHTIAEDRAILQRNVEHWLRLRDLPKPVIAMVHGYCLAGATQLCICTDIIFVAENASIGFPSIPAGGGYVSSFWNWMGWPHRTKQMGVFPSRPASATEAEGV